MGGTIITTDASPAAALWLLNELTTSKCLPEGMQETVGDCETKCSEIVQIKP